MHYYDWDIPKLSVCVCGRFLCQISANTRPGAHPTHSPGGKISPPLTKPRLTA